ncbi:hypothetical protein E8E14_008641 [Neopestalotiopsis sp. 37M]|nr:hypothetical protein E8E14_008641 [Neopestalotiopsis sp. 37M]
MLQNRSHPDWSSQSLENDLQNTLGDGYEIWQRTAQIIKDQLEHFQKTLTPHFKRIQNSKELQHNSFRHGIDRIAAPFMFSFDKTELDSVIGILRDSLEDLEWLRKRPQELGQPAATGSCLPRSGMSSQQQYKIESIRKAARETFEALRSLFEIENPDSKGALRCRHSASIIDGEIDQDVYMNVAIAWVTTIEAKSVDEALNWPIETSLNITDQLKIARDLVAAVLKFYATPWLAEYFSLKDIRFFTISEDKSESLQTLHLGIDSIYDGTGRNTKLEISNNVPNDWAQQQRLEDERLQRGIRNSTLWSLGVILLQVGSWSRTPAPDDVLAVRKASLRSSRMGPQYQKLTKQCLDCDFGHGEDLSETALQLAVYENIYGKLTAMVDSISLQCV